MKNAGFFKLTSAGLGLVVMSNPLVSRAQSTFRNLDFGLSQVPTSTTPGTFVAANIAVPFWMPYAGTNQATRILYNSLGTGSVLVDLLSPNDAGDGGIPGQYTVVLQAGIGGVAFLSAAIAQTAQITTGTMSLLFLATPPNGGGWQLTVGDQQIPVVEVSQGSRFNEYGANISSFAGQIDELRFTAPRNGGSKHVAG